MKPAYEKLAASVEDGVNCNVVQGRSFGCVWHFHPEYEITLTRQARGHRMVGDNLSSLTSGDMVLVGANLPHDWHNYAGAPGSFINTVNVRKTIQQHLKIPSRQLVMKTTGQMFITNSVK